MSGALPHLLLLSLALVTSASIVRNASWKSLVLNDGRQADAYVPACVSSSSPIVIGFHGLGFKDIQQPEYDHFYMDAERECAVVVYPQGKSHAVNMLGWAGYSWNAGGCCPDANVDPADDVSFIDEVIEGIVTDYGANGDLVFASGISNGAMMANRYACYSTRVKGVIAVAGPLVNGTGGSGGEPFSCSRVVPTLYFHGTRDPIYPYYGCNATWSSFGHLCVEMYKLGPGFATNLPSVTDFIAQRIAMNGIDPSIQSAVSFLNNSARCESWGSAASNVTFCTLEGMGHAWPSRDNLCSLPWTTCDNDIDATSEAWRFMRAQSQRYLQESLMLV